MTQSWRPIETAPKDGTVILLWCDNIAGGPLYSIAYYDAAYPSGGGEHGPFVWCCEGADGGAWAEKIPTHWQPLPSPPGGCYCDNYDAPGKVDPLCPIHSHPTERKVMSDDAVPTKHDEPATHVAQPPGEIDELQRLGQEFDAAPLAAPLPSEGEMSGDYHELCIEGVDYNRPAPSTPHYGLNVKVVYDPPDIAKLQPNLGKEEPILGLVERLRLCASDQMWADHCEVSKRTVSAAADALERMVGESAMQEGCICWMDMPSRDCPVHGERGNA